MDREEADNVLRQVQQFRDQMQNDRAEIVQLRAQLQANVAAQAQAQAQPNVQVPNIPNVSGLINLATPFSGDDDDTAPNELEMFFNIIEQITVDAAHQRVNIARAKLRGKALEYLSSAEEAQTTNNWDVFKNTLRLRFATRLPTSIAMLKLNSLEQGKDEKVVDFANRVKTLGHQLLQPGNAAHNEVIQTVMNSAFKKGLLPKLSEGVFYRDPAVFNDAITEAIRLELNWSARKSEKEKKIKHVVNAMIEDFDFDTQELCAAMFKAGAKSKESKQAKIVDTTNYKQLKQDLLKEKTEKSEKNEKKANYTKTKPVRDPNTPIKSNQHILRDKDVICFNCNCVGHFARDRICCSYCKTAGHIIDNCRKRMITKDQGNLLRASVVHKQQQRPNQSA